MKFHPTHPNKIYYLSNSHHIRAFLLFIFFLLALPVVTSGAETAGSLKPVTLQLRWHHQFQFAGYYAAIAKGYYREAGFEVKLQEGGPGKNTVEEVLSGSAQFGVTNSEILLHRPKGKPLVVLAAIFQHSLVV